MCQDESTDVNIVLGNRIKSFYKIKIILRGTKQDIS